MSRNIQRGEDAADRCAVHDQLGAVHPSHGKALAGRSDAVPARAFPAKPSAALGHPRADEPNSLPAKGQRVQRIHYWPLDASDARQIAALQRRLFPAELTEPVAEIRQILENTAEHLVCNLSYGAYQGRRLVGYVFAYVESESLFHQRAEEVVYIKEIAVLPGFENQLRPMLRKLFLQWLAFAPRLPIEAHAVPAALARWKQLKRAFTHYGMTVATREEPPSAGRPAYHLLRFDFDPASIHLNDHPKKLPTESLQVGDVGVSVVTEPREWATLREDWKRLLRQTQGGSVLQSFEYLWRWWRYCGIWNSLRILVLRRGDAVIGIAPLMLEDDIVGGRVLGRLAFIGAPAETSRPRLLFGENYTTCLPVLLAWLDASAGGWDVLALDEQDDPLLIDAVAEHFRARGCRIERMRRALAEVDVSAATVTPPLRPTALLRQVDRMPALIDALDAYGELEYREYPRARPAALLEDRDAYFFYKSLAEYYGGDGRFVLRVLEQEGRAMAATFGITEGACLHSMRFTWRDGADRQALQETLAALELPELQAQGCSRRLFAASLRDGWPRRLAATRTVTTLRVLQPQAIWPALLERVLTWLRVGSRSTE